MVLLVQVYYSASLRFLTIWPAVLHWYAIQPMHHDVMQGWQILIKLVIIIDFNQRDLFSVGAFRRKTQAIVVTFFKTNEVTDLVSFIS